MDGGSVLCFHDDCSHRGSREHRHPGNGPYLAGASVVAYIIGEGLTDAANVETEVKVTTEEEV